MRRFLSFGLTALTAVAAASCSSGNDSDVELTPDGGGTDDSGSAPDFGIDPDSGLSGVKQISITPANPVVKIDLTTGTPVAGTVTFKATELVGTEQVDVTDKTTFALDDTTLGSFAGATFTSTTALPTGVLGKSTVVRGEPGKGVANVTVIALRVSGDKKDFFFVVPYQKDPEPKKDILKFGTNIKQVDVAVLMDTTASMGQEINNLRDALASETGLIPKLKAAIPDVGIAIARFEDFPVAPFGFAGSASEKADVPYELLTEVTTNKSKAQSAVFLLQAWRGGAAPESQYEAQYQLLTGEGFSWTAAVAGSIAAQTPKAGTSGGAHFRAGALPVVVQITDASWFEKSTYDAGTSGALSPHSKAEVVAAYDTLKAKFVGIHSLIEKAGGGMDTPCTNYATTSCDSAQGYKQAVEMAQATGSELDPSAFKGACGAGKCCTGVGGAAEDPVGGKCPLVYRAKPDGTGVDSGIVGAIQAISVGSAFDVTAIPRNDPANVDVDAKPVDAVKFIENIRAMGEGDTASGCAPRTTKDTDGDGVDDTFVGVIVGEPVCFEVNAAKNETVPPAIGKPQFFRAYIDVVGVPGSVKLDSREVLFLVPPMEQVAAK